MVERETPPIIAHRLAQDDGRYPAVLRARLGDNAPGALTAIGPVGFLNHRKTALFCSASSPGHTILAAYDRFFESSWELPT